MFLLFARLVEGQPIICLNTYYTVNAAIKEAKEVYNVDEFFVIEACYYKQ